jgi:hypothetical protein
MHRTEQFGSAQLRTIDARVLADDPLQRDFPSESTLDLTPEAKSWPVLPAIDKSFITISPEVLGFHPPLQLHRVECRCGKKMGIATERSGT